MTAEIVEHACRVLRREPTRMLSARALALRTCRDLGVEPGYARFLRIVHEHPDCFVILNSADPLLDGWHADDVERYAPALERAGIACGPTVLLTAGPAQNLPATASLRERTPLDLLMADVHDAVTDLLRAQRADPQGAAVAQAMAGLAALQPPRRHGRGS